MPHRPAIDITLVPARCRRRTTHVRQPQLCPRRRHQASARAPVPRRPPQPGRGEARGPTRASLGGGTMILALLADAPLPPLPGPPVEAVLVLALAAALALVAAADPAEAPPPEEVSTAAI